jgi:hypothetical protein
MVPPPAALGLFRQTKLASLDGLPAGRAGVLGPV